MFSELLRGFQCNLSLLLDVSLDLQQTVFKTIASTVYSRVKLLASFQSAGLFLAYLILKFVATLRIFATVKEIRNLLPKVISSVLVSFPRPAILKSARYCIGSHLNIDEAQLRYKYINCIREAISLMTSNTQ